MNEVAIVAILRENEFLRGVADEHLAKLAEVARVVDVPTGHVVFREGEPAANIYLVEEGNVSLEICAPGVGCRRILTASGGDLLGWSPVLAQSKLTATARALTPAKLVQISAGQVLTLAEHDPRFGYIFMQRAALALAKRLVATRMQLLDIFGEQMPHAQGGGTGG